VAGAAHPGDASAKATLLATATPHPEAPPRPPFLAARGLTRSFGGVKAVDAVDLSLAPGEMRCIIGPNGCGKTTLFNLLTGYLAPTSGEVVFRGRSLAGLALHEVARLGIGRKFQVPSVFPGLTVAENLRVARAGHPASGPGDVAVARLAAESGLDRDAGQLAGTLPHGRKQWLELAMVLATGPALMLLDEPAAGMTQAEKRETLRLIAGLRQASGVAILVIEHDMAFVEGLDCEVSVMVLGRIVASGPMAEIRRDVTVRRAYLGSAHG
jgi:ABC-type branched-subunit amino acid transport system ATPase component